MKVVQHKTSGTQIRGAWRRPRASAAVIGGSLAVAAASLLVVRAVSYDGWGWLIWGREILGRLPFATSGYPTWKPLVGMVAVPLAPLGSAAPVLWLLTARFGAVLAVVMAYRLGRRVAGRPAGVLAALSLILVPEWVFQSGVGGSEPLLTGLLLAAVDRHANKADGQGFTLVLLASLLRPESWSLLLVSAAVTWIRRPRVRPLVVVGVIAVPVLWFGGEYLGSGDPFRGGYLAKMSLEARLLRRGHTPPFWAVLGKASSALPLALLACAPIAFWRALPRRDPILLPLSVGALVWIGEVAVLAAMGYAGVTRFLFPGLAALAVVGAAGLVLVLRSPRLPLAIRVALGVAGLAAAALTSTPRLPATSREASRVERRQDMEQAVGRLLARVGPQTLRTAPHLSSEGVMLTNLAWRLDVSPGPLKHSHLPGLRVAARDKAWRPFWRRIHRKRRLYTARTVVHEGRFYLIAIDRRGPPSPQRGGAAAPVVAR